MLKVALQTRIGWRSPRTKKIGGPWTKRSQTNAARVKSGQRWKWRTSRRRTRSDRSVRSVRPSRWSVRPSVGATAYISRAVLRLPKTGLEFCFTGGLEVRRALFGVTAAFILSCFSVLLGISGGFGGPVGLFWVTAASVPSCVLSTLNREIHPSIHPSTARKSGAKGANKWCSSS